MTANPSEMSSNAHEASLDTARNSFRIVQTAILNVKPLHKDEADLVAPEQVFLNPKQRQWIDELKRLNKEFQERVALLTDKNRAVADCMNKFNAKLDLVTNQCLTNDIGGEPIQVSMSESGIAFNSVSRYAVGDYLALSITLLPDYKCVFLLGEVLRCETLSTDYKMAVRFYRLQDRERQALARQLLKSQMSDRKKNSLGDLP